MAKQEKSLLIGRHYGILTMGSAMSGIYEVSKCVKLNAESAVFEYPNGKDKFERKAVKYDDIYNLKESCEESIRNRPEYAAAYTRYIEQDDQFMKRYNELLKIEKQRKNSQNTK